MDQRDHAMTPAEAITEALRSAPGAMPGTDYAYTHEIAEALCGHDTAGPHHQAARLRRWSQILAAASVLLERSAP
jgi:hypothetical protein